MKQDDVGLDGSAFSVATFQEADAADRPFWHSRTPAERMEALETMRRLNYAYDPISDRIPRILEVLERT